MTVEHVHVHSGGQAIVGTLERTGGGDKGEIEEQVHAREIANAPEPALRSPDKGRDAVPFSRDAERPLPNARRRGDGPYPQSQNDY